MAKVSAQYIEGIKEGRKLLNWWKRDGFLSREIIGENIASLERLRAKLAPLANTAIEVEFFDGQIDFFRNQLEVFTKT